MHGSVLAECMFWKVKCMCPSMPGKLVLGAGKSTLLQIFGGKFMVGQDVVRILGRPAFHDLLLTSSGDLSYLGAQWRRSCGSLGSDVPMQVLPHVLPFWAGYASPMH